MRYMENARSNHTRSYEIRGASVLRLRYGGSFRKLETLSGFLIRSYRTSHNRSRKCGMFAFILTKTRACFY